MPDSLARKCVDLSSVLSLAEPRRAVQAVLVTGCPRHDRAAERPGDVRSVQDRHRGRCLHRRMKIEFLTSVAVIAPHPATSRKLYVDALGLPLESGDGDEYHHTEQIDGCKHFAVWPLSQAAEACFGTAQWPADRPVPQASIEFDVADAAAV